MWSSRICRSWRAVHTQNDPVLNPRCASISNPEKYIRKINFIQFFFSDSNVFYALKLGENFNAKALKTRCEDFLISSHTHHPLDNIPIATKYNLKRLLADSIRKASEVPRVQWYSDFDELEYSIRSKILWQIDKREGRTSYNERTNLFPDDNPEDGYVSLVEEDDYEADSESEMSD